MDPRCDGVIASMDTPLDLLQARDILERWCTVPRARMMSVGGENRGVRKLTNRLACRQGAGNGPRPLIPDGVAALRAGWSWSM